MEAGAGLERNERGASGARAAWSRKGRGCRERGVKKMKGNVECKCDEALGDDVEGEKAMGRVSNERRGE